MFCHHVAIRSFADFKDTSFLFFSFFQHSFHLNTVRWIKTSQYLLSSHIFSFPNSSLLFPFLLMSSSAWLIHRILDRSMRLFPLHFNNILLSIRVLFILFKCPNQCSRFPSKCINTFLIRIRSLLLAFYSASLPHGKPAKTQALSGVFLSRLKN